ncbi:type I secretion system permease/ATPase [Bradyrhizobium neotropicale]|uniref:type I secretion system permease/ATPase n=1 Tax=Bradyrhizobium neotropicale TaxID=1497615 RepID=UPI001AD697AB|nr:type I secretion system permease/ATPase [Bradyrhizobium neotropicale]MBO4221330.1 type I secretion system permease/ATPase [Bradyrhizobium neotropicale]
MPIAQANRPAAESELHIALASCRAALIAIAMFSGLINLLSLTGSLFMLEVYDRVLPSRSVPTLVGLSVIAAMLFVFQGILELTRGRMLLRIGNQIDWRVSDRVYDLVTRLPLRTRGGGDGLQPVRDLDTIRSVLSGAGLPALFDLPWLPIYLVICFAFHPLIGGAVLGGALVLVILTLLTDRLSRSSVQRASIHAAARNRLAEASRRNAEALAAMGMSARLLARWRELGDAYRRQQKIAGDISGGFGVVGRMLRMMLQSAVLAVGAYLVIHQEASGGIIIASSILTGRALAPVDLAIANWRSFVAARQSWRRLEKLLAAIPAPATQVPLPAPSRTLLAEKLSVTAPESEKPLATDINFVLKAGSALGIIGASGSGKSSLVRALVGAWPPLRGVVRLDGAALEQWSSETLGNHIGYLPQDVELFEGTIAENIARFVPNPPMEMVLAAANAAGIHQLIVGLPEGYNTQIGEQGARLSAGQRQRVALARALYADPFLVVLDEPNSNLDAEGEEALTRAILAVRVRGGIVVIVAHRSSALAAVDFVMTMANGRQQTFGPKDEVLSMLTRREPPPAGPFKVVPQTAAST